MLHEKSDHLPCVFLFFGTSCLHVHMKHHGNFLKFFPFLDIPSSHHAFSNFICPACAQFKNQKCHYCILKSESSFWVWCKVLQQFKQRQLQATTFREVLCLSLMLQSCNHPAVSPPQVCNHPDLKQGPVTKLTSSCQMSEIAYLTEQAEGRWGNVHLLRNGGDASAPFCTSLLLKSQPWACITLCLSYSCCCVPQLEKEGTKYFLTGCCLPVPPTTTSSLCQVNLNCCKHKCG